MFMEIPQHVREYLRTDDPKVEETDFGAIFKKGTYSRELATQEGRLLRLGHGEVSDESVLFMRGGICIPIRTDDEVNRELITNIGDTDIIYRRDVEIHCLRPNQSRWSVWRANGMVFGLDHGYAVEKGDGYLYIAKALRPEYVDVDSPLLEITHR